MTAFDKIKKLLDENNIHYEYKEHEEVRTSIEAAKARGEDIKIGAKALLLKCDEVFKIFILSAALKLDNKQVKEITGAKSIRFATPEEVEKITGCLPGAVPPFPNLFGLDYYVDKSILKNDYMAFNAGERSKSIKMKVKDYLKLQNPEIEKFSLDEASEEILIKEKILHNIKHEEETKKMKFTTIQEAIDKGEGKVNLHGWVHRERGSNKLKFIVLRDSSNIIQCVIKKEKFQEEKFAEADKLQIETSLELHGVIKEDKRAPTGYEVDVDEFTVVGPSDSFPIKADQNREFQDDNRHLTLRTRRMTAILKIRSTVFGAIHEYFRKHKFYEYQSPIFQSVQCEGGSTLFNVNYFDKKDVFLAQTWQLYAEPAIFALEKIYTVAPSFRAEKSKTSRHLTEYWHAEMEISWCKFKDIQDHGEGVIKHVIKKVLENNADDLKTLERDVHKLKKAEEKDFVRVTYTEALEILKEKAKINVEWGKDLRTIEEDELSKMHDTFIICTNYPKEVKAFYMMQDDEDPRTVQGCDFIAPEGYGEIIGGSQREHDIEKLKARLLEVGEKLEEYTFYLDTRKYGSIPHGGFGMGVERLISYICGLDNIKDAIPFPRTPLRYKP